LHAKVYKKIGIRKHFVKKNYFACKEKKKNRSEERFFLFIKHPLPGVAEEVLGIGEAEPALATAGLVAFALAPTMQQKAQMLGGYVPTG
jgi:hypothetical protein